MKINQPAALAYYEAANHGTEDFPLAYYPNLVSVWREFFFVPHWHKEIEILCVHQGQLELVVNGFSRKIKANTIVLIPPNTLHTAYRIAQQSCRFSCIVFSEQLITSRQSDRIQSQQIDPFLIQEGVTSYVDFPDKSQQSLTLFQLFDQCFMGKSSYRELRLKGIVIQLLSHLLEVGTDQPAKKSSERLQEKREKIVLSYIHSNYHEMIQLQDLADSVSLSKEQFTRFFKQSFRTSPMAYLNHYRLIRSAELLRETDLTMVAIAQAVGFCNSNHFSVCFKKMFCETPTQYRKNDMITIEHAIKSKDSPL